MSTQEYEKARDEAAFNHCTTKSYLMSHEIPVHHAFKVGSDFGASYRLKEIVEWLRDQSTGIECDKTMVSSRLCVEIAYAIKKKFGGGNENEI